MEGITFGVDIDQVLRDILSNMVELYNIHFNQNIKFDEVKEYDVEKAFPAISSIGVTASKWFFQNHNDEIFNCAKSIGNPSDCISRLRKIGKVIIISYQKSNINKIGTLLWLEKHNIEYDGICFVKDKSIVHTDYLIDDNDWNFSGCHAKHGILITAPYNKDKEIVQILDSSYCKDMTRFDTLEEFVKYIENKKEKK